VDDQYGLGYSRSAPKKRFVKTALEAVLAGGQPKVAATEAPGCQLDLEPPREMPAVPTYHAQISRHLQNHCVECHRQGGVGPFALETYEQVKAKSGMVRKMVERGLMPPWFAAPLGHGQESPWNNDRSLPEKARAELLGWLEGGKPLGDPSFTPSAPGVHVAAVAAPSLTGEAVSALLGLGMAEVNARRAVDQALIRLGEEAELPAVIRAALQELGR
jgi:hypothetical protein